MLDEEAEKAAHESVVRKLAVLMRGLEEQAGFLKREEMRAVIAGRKTERGCGAGWSGQMEEREGEKRSIYALLEMIMEDLNNYCECMIPIGKITYQTDTLFHMALVHCSCVLSFIRKCMLLTAAFTQYSVNNRKVANWATPEDYYS